MAPITLQEVQAELARRAALAATPAVPPEEQAIIDRRIALQQQIGQAEAEVAGLERAGTSLVGFGRGITPLALGPLSRKAVSGIESLFSDQTYSEIEAQKQAAWERAQQQYPGTAVGMELLAGLAGGNLALKAAGALTGTAAKIAPYLVGGTLQGKTALGTAGKTLGRDVAESSLYFAGEDLEADEMAKAVALQSGVGQLLRGATAARKVVGEKGKEIGLGIQRSALGSRFGDYLQSAKRAGLAPENKQLEALTKDLALDANEELSEQILSTKVKQAQNRLLEQKVLPKTRDPAELGAFLQSEFSSLTAKVNSAIDAVDASKKQIAFVDTSKTNKLLQSGKYSGDQIKEITDYIADRQNQFQSTDRGKLRFLQEQKKGIADRYKADQKGLAPVYRSLYNDYKRHIEKYAPPVRDLNRQVSDLKTVEIPIYRGIALQEAFDTMGAINRLKFTTGGLMAPIIAGGVGALPFGAVGGAVLGTALAAGATRPGKRIIGELLTRIAPTIGQPTGIGNVLGRSIRAGQTLESEPQAEPAAATMPMVQTQGGITLDAIRNELQRRGLSLSNMVGPTEAQAAVRPIEAETPKGLKWAKAPASVLAEISRQEPLIQAMIYQESRGDAKAKSKAGAAGLMQLMPGTAKELGVKNVFDAKQNIAAGTKYVEKMRKRFGDDSLALAAYNWGPGNVSKAVRQAAKALKKDASEVTWDDVLSEVTVPTETKKYVERVFRLREQFSGQV